MEITNNLYSVSIKRLRAFYLLLLLLLGFGCKGKSQYVGDIPVVKVDVSSAIDRDFEGKIDIVEIVALETSDVALISEIDKLIVTDNYIVTASLTHMSRGASKVDLFDRNGRFLRTIGRQGRGPGEHTGVGDIWLNEDKNEIYILDARNSYILTFDLDGNLLSNIDPGIMILSICKIDNGIWSYSPAVNPEEGVLMLLDADSGEIKKRFLPQNSYFPIGWIPQFFDDGEDGVCFAYPHSDIVYRLEGGEPRPMLRIDFGKHTQPFAEIRKIKDTDTYNQRVQGRGYMGSIDQLIFCGDGMLFFPFTEIMNRGEWGYPHSVYYNMTTGDMTVYNSMRRPFSLPDDSKYPLKEIHHLSDDPITAHNGLWVHVVKPQSYSLSDENLALLRERVCPEITRDSNPLLYFVKRF
ncbi:MAG: 6-bladed beta-propeller [Rikenellaceae bacterium]|nr:6-bladed beta-propeller [Rikenellaceae bacterium]MCL2693213.1 6-bladed beta-propeller [Rikenellaceae bacterium]